MKVPGGLDAVFRQATPLFLLGVVGAVVCEPWLPGLDWLRQHFGEAVVLRGCVAALGLYVLLLWGESLRLHAMLTAVLRAFREFGADKPKQGAGAQNRNARIEAARLLIAALASSDPEIRATSHHNLKRLTGVDHGAEVGPWQAWLAEQERATAD
ncbi:MAG TPA: hypothetical protein VFZ65_18620 [Planctomycetota bacterium]|nr:hypothetical protein [Planctomycetota bacterium]